MRYRRLLLSACLLPVVFLLAMSARRAHRPEELEQRSKGAIFSPCCARNCAPKT